MKLTEAVENTGKAYKSAWSNCGCHVTTSKSGVVFIRGASDACGRIGLTAYLNDDDWESYSAEMVEEQEYERLLDAQKELQLTKLQQNSHKSGWLAGHGCSLSDLVDMLEEEVTELKDGIINGENSYALGFECADIANFAMMIADHLQDREVSDG